MFEPTIKICLEGFKVSRFLGNALKVHQETIRNNSMLASVFISNETNQVYKANDTIRMPHLALTLTLISQSNTSDVFYDGVLTKLIVEEMNENGSLMLLTLILKKIF